MNKINVKSILIICLLFSFGKSNDITLMRNKIVGDILKGEFSYLDVDIDSTARLGSVLNINAFSAYELISLKMLQQDYPFLFNIDSLEYIISSQYSSRVIDQNDALRLNITDIMSGFSKRIHSIPSYKIQSLSNQVFLKSVAVKLDTLSQVEVNKFIKENADLIESEEHFKFITEFIWYQVGPSNNYWGMGYGAAQTQFVNGAESVLDNAVAFNLSFFVKREKLYLEYLMSIINTNSKKDIIQGDYVYPKESGPQLLHQSIMVGYPLNFLPSYTVPYVGISHNLFSIAENQAEEFEIKNDIEGSHFSVNFGCLLTYNSGWQWTNNIGQTTNFGLRLRTNYTILSAKEISNLKGGMLSFTISLVMNNISLERKKYPGI